jgi:preprotein translocase subunit YajC
MPFGVLIFVLLAFAAYFVLVLVPRKRARVAQAELLAALEVGEEVLTAGGLIGTIKALDGDIVQLQLAENVVVKADRRAIAGQVLPPDESEDGARPDRAEIS